MQKIQEKRTYRCVDCKKERLAEQIKLLPIRPFKFTEPNTTIWFTICNACMFKRYEDKIYPFDKPQNIV